MYKIMYKFLRDSLCILYIDLYIIVWYNMDNKIEEQILSKPTINEMGNTCDFLQKAVRSIE